MDILRALSSFGEHIFLRNHNSISLHISNSHPSLLTTHSKNKTMSNNIIKILPDSNGNNVLTITDIDEVQLPKIPAESNKSYWSAFTKKTLLDDPDIGVFLADVDWSPAKKIARFTKRGADGTDILAGSEPWDTYSADFHRIYANFQEALSRVYQRSRLNAVEPDAQRVVEEFSLPNLSDSEYYRRCTDGARTRLVLIWGYCVGGGIPPWIKSDAMSNVTGNNGGISPPPPPFVSPDDDLNDPLGGGPPSGIPTLPIAPPQPEVFPPDPPVLLTITNTTVPWRKDTAQVFIEVAPDISAEGVSYTFEILDKATDEPPTSDINLSVAKNKATASLPPADYTAIARTENLYGRSEAIKQDFTVERAKSPWWLWSLLLLLPLSFALFLWLVTEIEIAPPTNLRATTPPAARGYSEIDLTWEETKSTNSGLFQWVT